MTPHQTRVLRLLAGGRTQVEVGREMYIERCTVKTALVRLSAELGARNTVHAVVLAHELGVLPLGCAGEPVGLPTRMPVRPRQRVMPTDLAQVPVDVYERYPSCRWGETEWAAALDADDDLYFRVLKGIGRAATRHRKRQ